MEHTQCGYLTGITARKLGQGDVDVFAMEEEVDFFILLYGTYTTRLPQRFLRARIGDRRCRCRCRHNGGVGMEWLRLVGSLK